MKVSNIDEVKCISFFSVGGAMLQIHHQIILQNFSTMFSSNSFKALALMPHSLIYFQLILYIMQRKSPTLFFFLQHHDFLINVIIWQVSR